MGEERNVNDADCWTLVCWEKAHLGEWRANSSQKACLLDILPFACYYVTLILHLSKICYALVFLLEIPRLAVSIFNAWVHERWLDHVLESFHANNTFSTSFCSQSFSVHRK